MDINFMGAFDYANFQFKLSLQHVCASPAKVTSATLLPTTIYQHNTISYIRGCFVVKLGENEVVLRDFCVPAGDM
jgi:hypothetical protein